MFHQAISSYRKTRRKQTRRKQKNTLRGLEALEDRRLLAADVAFQFVTIASDLHPTNRFFGSTLASDAPFSIIRYGLGTTTAFTDLPGLSALVPTPGDLTFSFGSMDTNNPVDVLTLSSFDDGLGDGLANQIYTPDADDDSTLTVFNQGVPIATGDLVQISLETTPQGVVTSPASAPSQFRLTSAVGDPTIFNELIVASGGSGVFDFTLSAFNLDGPWAGVGDAEFFSSNGAITNLVSSSSSAGLLKDIGLDAVGSSPREFTGVGGETYFTANNTELWKTDGTSMGTVLVKDVGSGAGSAYLSSFVDHNGTLAFLRVDSGDSSFTTDDDQIQLWKSDGTSAGTQLVHDFGVGSFTGISEGARFVSLGDNLFTGIGTSTAGIELWKSDLTSTGTMMVRDINPGSSGSNPDYLLDFNGTLFFAADDGLNGRELWKSDGTSGGTVLVKDIDPASSIGSYPSSYPNGFTVKDGNFYFGASSSGPDETRFTDDDSGQLWKSDGTTAGTVLVKDFGPGSNGYTSLLNVGGTLFGLVHTEADGAELWKSDGTESGTVLLKDINPGVGNYGDNIANSSYPRRLTDVNGTLFFTANDGDVGRELWKSDGTTVGTVLVKDIDTGVGGSSAYPYLLTNANGTLFFAADDGSSGQELWKSDGTSEGTVLVQDINTANGGADSSYLYPLRFINGLLFFGANDGVAGSEPWVLDPVVDFDFGDAPDSFGTLAASDGPQHGVGGALFLGNEVDSDVDGQPNTTATGDDIDASPNDNDAVAQYPRFVAGATESFDVVASADGMIDAWLDLNGNGVFENPAEHIGNGISVAVTAGSNTLSFAVPIDAAPGATYARIRISSAGGLAPGGSTYDGEVEDYYVAIRLSTTASDWQNPANLLDPNGDGTVSPIDALVIINSLNQDGSRLLGENPGVPEFWYDVSGDNSASPIDVLQVVNFLNGGSGEGVSGEGESADAELSTTNDTRLTLPPLSPHALLSQPNRRRTATARRTDVDRGESVAINLPRRAVDRDAPVLERPTRRRASVVNSDALDAISVKGLFEITEDIAAIWLVRR